MVPFNGNVYMQLSAVLDLSFLEAELRLIGQ